MTIGSSPCGDNAVNAILVAAHVRDLFVTIKCAAVPEMVNPNPEVLAEGSALQRHLPGRASLRTPVPSWNSIPFAAMYWIQISRCLRNVSSCSLTDSSLTFPSMKPSTLFLGAIPFSILAGASPTPQTTSQSATTLLADIEALLTGTLTGINSAFSSGNWNLIQTYLEAVIPLSTGPASGEDAIAKLALVNSTKPSNIYSYVAKLRALNLVDSVEDLLQYVQGTQTGMNSMNNNNRNPPSTVYPQKCSCDAPYSVSEAALRGAIYIPSGFTYGQKPPVILFPGTGATGYTTFAGNYIPLLTGVSYADPVWVNVPGYLLGDAQVSAEYAAYAINYISTLTSTNVTVVAWSQGNINMQWAYKYWPCTRRVVSDHIANSADYDGTIFADFISPPGVALPPSILQQRYLGTSNFINTLHTNNGDSAYVPTTSIYSGLFDEIVEPQQGTGASAFINNVRNVGASNSEVQLVCPLQPAGTFYTHEGVLYNPLSFALFRDAMTKSGVGQASDLSLSSVCSTYLTPGLNVGDFTITENVIAIAALAILVYQPKVLVEPAISAYALQSPVTNLAQCSVIGATSSSTSTSTSSKATSTTSGSVSGSTTTSSGSTRTSTSSTTTRAAVSGASGTTSKASTLTSTTTKTSSTTRSSTTSTTTSSRRRY